jgi:nucleotide-binding universal stress UspA family protein
MKILLAVDGSPSSLDARDLVAGLPWPSDTRIIVLTAFEVPATWFTGPALAGDWFTGAMDALREQAREDLATIALPLEQRGWTIEQRVTEGRAATVILAAADEVDADLIVVGSRGRGPIRSMLLGSVSAEVTNESRRSVLVARGKTVSRVLVATDGTECSSVIPEVLTAWDALPGLEAIALSVTPVDSPTFDLLISLYTFGEQPLERQREELKTKYRDIAAQMAQRLLSLGMTAKAEMRSGDAAHEIVTAAADHEADLIVTGSRCLHGLDRWLLGSVARNVVLHAHASVLVIRDKDELARQ